MQKIVQPGKFYKLSPSNFLRTQLIMNKGIMQWSIRNLKRELALNDLDKEITLEMAVDWLTASKMFTEEEIADFLESF